MNSENENKPDLLIIDDERSIVETLTAVMQIRGYTVTGAFSSEEGLELLEKGFRPDVMVLDVLLPGINGIDFCKSLKQDPKYQDIPILMITVITKDTESPDGFWKIGSGADDFLTKPFDPFELAARIDRLIGRSSDHRTSDR